MNYLEALKIFKTSLYGGSEVPIISNIIDGHFKNKKSIGILDVGIGDGDSLNRILKNIEPAREFHITAVDPVLADSMQAQRTFPKAKCIADSFDNYHTDEVFDVVHVRQSLYYLDKKESALEKMLQLVASGGLLLITHWSSNDIFCRLHNTLFPGSKINITGENIVEFITHRHPGIKIDVIQFDGEVDINSWRATSKMREAVLTIISREEIHNTEMRTHTARFRHLLEGLNPTERRSNLVIFVMKS
jgi:ubiquinone/menaquinone biosynthesis C-methylase UbiE